MRRLFNEEWDRWQQALGRVRRDRYEEPLLPGGWSVKATIGHISFYEDLLAAYLEGREPPAPDVPPDVDLADVDSRNAWLEEQHRRLPLEAVLRDSDRSHAKVVELVDAIEDRDLDRPVPAYGIERPLWRTVAAESYFHYPEHAELLETALSDAG
jgi:hypothetical protein